MSLPLGRATILLAVVVALLGALDWALGRSRESARRAECERVKLSPVRAFEPAEAERLDVTLGDGRGTWTYVKKDGAYRIPRYRDAFALSANVDSIMKSVVDGRGTRAGDYPADAERFGLLSRDAMKIELRDRDGYLLLEALAGRVAPGERGDECFVAQEDGTDVLLLDSNPWTSLTRSDDGRLPPLVDTRVVPLALGRRSVARIGISPSQSGLTELFRREIPVDPASPDPDKGPRFEWLGIFEASDDRLVNDMAARQFAGFVGEITFDELVGPAASERARVGAPQLTLVLHDDGGTADTLTLGGSSPDGRRYLHSSATEQVFLVSPDAAASLIPDVAALNAPAPKKDERGG